MSIMRLSVTDMFLVAEPALACVFTGIADSIPNLPPDDKTLDLMLE
jgi:hypothetical protein